MPWKALNGDKDPGSEPSGTRELQPCFEHQFRRQEEPVRNSPQSGSLPPLHIFTVCKSSSRKLSISPGANLLWKTASLAQAIALLGARCAKQCRGHRPAHVKDTSLQVLPRDWAVFLCSLGGFSAPLLGWFLVLFATTVILRLDKRQKGG